jgi:autotransporter-associated beta strand protein
VWNTASGVTIPDIYGTGGLTFRSSSTLQGINTSWFQFFQRQSSFTFGHPDRQNGPITFTACSTCYPEAENFTGKTFTIAGPITIHASEVVLNSNLSTSDTSTGNIAINTGALSGSGAISLANGKSLTITQSGSSTYSGAVSGTLSSLTKGGTGTLTLSGANTYTGLTSITDGTLILDRAGSTTGTVLADTGAVTVNGGTLTLNDLTETVGAVTLTSGSITAGAAGNALTGTSYTLNPSSGTNHSISAVLAGTSIALTKSSAGTVTLSGNNTYTGLTTINGGILEVNFTNSTGFVVNDGGTLRQGAGNSYQRATYYTINSGGSYDLNGKNLGLNADYNLAISIST